MTIRIPTDRLDGLTPWWDTTGRVVRWTADHGTAQLDHRLSKHLVTRWPQLVALIGLLAYLRVTFDHLAVFPPVGQDEPWIAAAPYKLATQGVFGSVSRVLRNGAASVRADARLSIDEGSRLQVVRCGNDADARPPGRLRVPAAAIGLRRRAPSGRRSCRGPSVAAAC